MLLVANRSANDRQVGLEIELEDTQRFAHVGRRRCDGHQGQDDVALAHVVFDPFLVDRDIAFEEVHSRVRYRCTEAVGRHVHAVDLPIGVFENALGQMVADEAIDAEDQNFFHDAPDFRSASSKALSSAAGTGSPPARSRCTAICLPSPQTPMMAPSTTRSPGAKATPERSTSRDSRALATTTRTPATSLKAPG